MEMTLCLSQSQSLEISGGSTDSCLPLVDAWLNESSDHWNALAFVARRKDMNRYRSVCDFLLAEIVTEERAACLRFYDGRGAPLREIRNARTIAVYEARILVFLEVCHAAHCQERALSWPKARQIVAELVAA